MCVCKQYCAKAAALDTHTHTEAARLAYKVSFLSDYFM